MKIITVLNQKGGSGKTTVCLHLAVGFARTGKKVVIIDCDRQESAVRWGKKAPLHKRQAPPVVQATGTGVKERISQLDADTDYVLIDTAGDFRGDAQRQTLDLLDLVHLVVVPALPTPLDVEGARDVLQALQLYRQTREGPEVRVLVNKAKRGAMTDNARKHLGKFGFSVLDASLGDRVAYAAEVGYGGTAFDRRKSDKARAEAESLLNEIGGVLA